MVTQGGQSRGFTIVELLIVIVVIGILAAIVLVAYNGIQAKAQTNAIYNEMVEWQKLFTAYKEVNGVYPNPSPSGNPLTDGGPGSNVLKFYCLGSGFPNGYCYSDNPAADANDVVAESKNASLMSQLATVGNITANSKKYVYDGLYVGPFLQYENPNLIAIWDMLPANGTTCPSGTAYGGNTSGRTQCYILMN